MTSKRRRKSDDDAIDRAHSRAFEQGELDTPEIRRLEAKAWRARDARIAARRELDALGDLMLPVHVRREGKGWVAYLPYLKIRGDGSTQARAKAELQKAFAEKIALDPIGALEGIRATGQVKQVRFKVRA